MPAGPITDSAQLHQRIRRWAREIWAATVITAAAVVLLAAANWRAGPSNYAGKRGADPAMTLADQHPTH